MNGKTIATALLVLFGLVGCIAPTDAPVMDSGSTGDSTRTLEFSGTLAAEKCTDSGQVNTCQNNLFSGSPDKSPPAHTVWHEVMIEEDLESMSVETDWDWEEPGSATFYVALEWQDDIIAERTREVPLMHIDDASMDGFDPDDHRLWLYFGVKPVETPSGKHYPRVDVEYTITVHLDEGE